MSDQHNDPSFVLLIETIFFILLLYFTGKPIIASSNPDTMNRKRLKIKKTKLAIRVKQRHHSNPNILDTNQVNDEALPLYFENPNQHKKALMGVQYQLMKLASVSETSQENNP